MSAVETALQSYKLFSVKQYEAGTIFKKKSLYMTGTPRYRRSKLKKFLLYPLRGRQTYSAYLRRVPQRLPFPQQTDQSGILHRLRFMALDASLASAHLHPFRFRQLPALVQPVPDVLPFHLRAKAEARHIYRRYAANLAVLAEQGQVLLLEIHIHSGINTLLDEFKHLPNRPADPAQLTDEHHVHPLGHGIGINIHEFPRLSPRSTDILKNGMVFSDEPGVYFEGDFGIRIEDSVTLVGGKVVSLTNTDKKLLIL